MTKPFRPMLACEVELDKLRYPCIATPKLDGVRAVVRGGVVYSRSNKPIPNKHVQALFGWAENMDGELIVGSPCAEDVYRQTVSGVMTEAGEPDVYFHIFDAVHLSDYPYTLRAAHLLKGERIVKVPATMIHNEQDLLAMQESLLGDGFEGLILRNPTAYYKQGRGTMRDQCLMKLKLFVDGEARIIGFQERMHNANELEYDERGYAKRSSHQENQIGRGDLGALIVEANGVEFKIGTGFDDETCARMWADRDNLLGKLVKYKSTPIGVKDKPRHPSFLGMRHEDDL